MSRKRKISRLQNWDYGWDGAYFITICTKNRVHYFGKIVNHKMVLSQIGIIANTLWYEIKSHASNVELGAFIIMPNHLHGILYLQGNKIIDNDSKSNCSIGQKRFQNQGKNTISSIIGSYKSAVTRHARRLGYIFAWQSRFYDNIIRNNQAHTNIQNYIINNPSKWEEDRFK